MSEGLGSAGGEKLDERLLDAAEATVAERGFEGLDSAEAAQAAGLEASVTLPTELELFAGVVERDEARFDAAAAAAVARKSDPGERLLALIEACVVHYDWGVWIELWSLALRDGRARELRTRLDAGFRAQIVRLIDEGVAAGAFEVEDSERAALAIAAVIDALAVEATLGDDTVLPNFMFGACALIAGRLVGAELRIMERSVDG